MGSILRLSEAGWVYWGGSHRLFWGAHTGHTAQGGYPFRAPEDVFYINGFYNWKSIILGDIVFSVFCVLTLTHQQNAAGWMRKHKAMDVI